MTLYEIDLRILQGFDEETGEIFDEAAIDALEMEQERKRENIALFYKNEIAEAEAIKAEIANLQSRKKAAENRAERLKNYLERSLAGQAFKTARAAVAYRKSERVEVEDVWKLPERYLKYKDPEPNKIAIKAAIKAGLDVNGAILVRENNMSIK